MNPREIRLAELLRKHEVRTAYLFGSQQEAGSDYLQGRETKVDEKSDLDIGVVVNRPPEHMFEYYGNLYADLSGIFQPFKIDLVFFHEVHALLKYDMIRGQCVYAADQRRTDDDEEMVMKTAEDLAYKRREFERDFTEAITHGHFEFNPR
jgi:predicted nucleotidyltransferase